MTNPPVPPIGRPLTLADLATFPDDGHRYELLDGSLLTSPAPDFVHEDVVGRLVTLLRAAEPPELRTVLGPFAVRFGWGTELRPDLLVARHSDLTSTNLSAAPVLVVEVTLPNTVLLDHHLKPAAYARYEVPSYWVVDPDEPRVTVFELQDGTYIRSLTAVGEEVVEIAKPFPVRFTPWGLIGGSGSG